MDIPNALRGRDLVVVDVEGNGQTPAEIIEIAVLHIATETVAPDAVRSWMIRPRTPITPVVTRNVHGIANDDVANCPKWADVADEIDSVLAGRTLVAHNASVEQRILASHLPYWNPPMVLDTLRLARKLWLRLPSYSLGRLIEHAQLDDDASKVPGSHRAAPDAWATWLLLNRLVADGNLDWAALVSTAAPREFVPPPEPEFGLW